MCVERADIGDMMENPLLEGLRFRKDAEPFVVFIFGVTGDLTKKKLVPALFSLYLKGRIGDFKVVGFARRPWSREYLQEQAADMISEFPSASEEQRRAFLDKFDYLQSNFQDVSGYQQIEEYAKPYKNILYYLSAPPSMYQDIIRNLGESSPTRERGSEWNRIIVEKPFGHDLATAQALNRLLSTYFEEHQVFRIDHYLGKETVQNIMLLRFGNGIFEPVWNSSYVDHIQISVSEKIGVETRGAYYEKSGTLRDMVQNHVFQILSLTTMEPPSSLDALAIRDEKVKILNALRPITLSEIDSHTVRGQYAGGILDGEEVPGYREEEDVDEESTVETFVALKLYVDSWRWSGVPIFLRSGKRLARKASEVSVHFKEPPLRLFASNHPAMTRNTLIMRIQPKEGITLNMNAKVPGHTTETRPVNMDFSYGQAFSEPVPEAYERLIFDAIAGDSTLYNRRDEVESSWRFIDQVMEGWQRSGKPAALYLPGSAGPEESRLLIASEGRRWRKL
jgi:glucose-6-phosphate 1-dehydrogenase